MVLDTKTRIRECAAQHLRDAGPVNFSVKRVAELAEVTQSQINYHFGGKDDLLVEVCTSMLVAHIEDSIAKAEASSDPAESVLAFVETVIEFAQQFGATAVLVSSPELFSSDSVSGFRLEAAAAQVLDASERSSTVLFSACYAVAKGTEYRRLNRGRIALAAIMNPRIANAVVVIGMACGGFARVLTQHQARPIFGFSPARLLRSSVAQVLRDLSVNQDSHPGLDSINFFD